MKELFKLIRETIAFTFTLWGEKITAVHVDKTLRTFAEKVRAL